MTTEASTPTGGWVPSDTFATRLLIARTQRGLTQQQAADACGINRATWALWEGGSSPRNMADVVVKIAAGLGVDRDWLLWGGPLSHPSGPDRGPGLHDVRSPRRQLADEGSECAIRDSNPEPADLAHWPVAA